MARDEAPVAVARLAVSRGTSGSLVDARSRGVVRVGKLAALALISILVAACGQSTATAQPPGIVSATPVVTAPSTPVSTPTASAAPSTAGVGDPVEAGSWTITVNGAEQGTSDNQFLKPDPGNVFWVIDVTLANNASAAADAGTGVTIQDDKDFTHDAEVLGVKKPELGGPVLPAGRTRGYVTFQVAEDARPIMLFFQPDIFDNSVIVSIALS